MSAEGDLDVVDSSGRSDLDWALRGAVAAVNTPGVVLFLSFLGFGAMKGDEERIRGGGCEAYLSKPISVAKFLETVRHYLGDS